MADVPESPAEGLDGDATLTAGLAGVDRGVAPPRPGSGKSGDGDDRDSEPGPGDSIGRYRIDERLGAGGMGVVYRGYDPTLDREVAIKLMRGTGFARDSHLARRLVREAQAAAKLSHPNVVSVYEVDADVRGPYIAMELVRGVTLRKWLAAERRGWRETLAAFLAAGRGLAAAHEVGIVHRDVKPDNILVGDDRVRVADFGIARPAGVELADEGGVVPVLDPEDELRSATITETGTILGTPRYMSPEQRSAQPCDARTDQYSFCVALHEALYGHVPTEEPPSPERDVPSWIRPVLERGTAAEPADRYPSMRELLAALTPPASKRTWWVAGAGAVAVAVVIVAAVLLRGTSDSDPCGDVGLEAAQVWTADARSSVSEALIKRMPKVGQSTFDRVAAKLDPFPAAWRGKKQQVCRDRRTAKPGTRADQMHRRRDLCLDRQLVRVRAAVEQLAKADKANAIRGVLTAGAATGYRCDDLDALSRQPALPSDPETMRRLRAAQSEADRLNVESTASQFRDIGDRVAALLKEARAIGDLPLLVEALRLASDEHGARARYEQAAELVRETIRVGARAGDDWIVATSWSTLMFYVGNRMGKWKEALAMRTAAEAAIERAGDKPLLRARYANTLGMLLKKAGRLPEALEQLELSVRLAEKELGSDNTQLSASLNNLGTLYWNVGRLEDAERAIRRVIRIRAKRYGDHHPSQMSAYNNLGGVLKQLGKLDEAERMHLKQLSIVETFLGPNHFAAALVNQNLGEVSRARERHDEAETRYRKALAIHTKRGRADSEQAAIVYLYLGNNNFIRKRHAEGLEQCRRALAMLTKHAPNSRHRASAMGCVARSLHESGKHRAAVAGYERGLELMRERGIVPRKQALFRYLLARALWEGKIDRKRAVREARAGLEIASPKTRKEIEAWLAKHAK